MPKQTEDAINRIQYLERYIKGKGQINCEKLYAEMSYNFGVMTRTTARYLKTLEMLGIIEINDQMIEWVERNEP